MGYAPIFDPPRWGISDIFKYFFSYPGYFAPWNIIYYATVCLSHKYTTPRLELCKTFEIGWLAQVFGRNQLLLWIFSGGWHGALYWPLYLNDMDKKYDKKWPAKGKKFLFGDQTLENVFTSCTSGVLIWSALEALFLRAWSLGRVKGLYLDVFDRPIWSLAQLILIPFWREFHFYWIHRMSHWGPLYKWVHYFHHKNVNPGPWSGLSMHPVEHLLYFSVVAPHLWIPGHPMHMFFNMQHTALTPASGHNGFHGPVFGDTVHGGSYFHYLHHRYFECNYGEATIPFDRWFGTFRDGKSVVGKSTSTEGGRVNDSRWITALTLGVGTLCSLVPLVPLLHAGLAP